MSQTKAVRAEIKLGEIPLRVYMLANGTYKLAGRNVTDAIGMRMGSLTEKMGVKTLKALPHMDKSLTGIKAETGESFIPIALEDAATYWGIMARDGNEKALAILVASTTESIERRADAVFNVQRQEEERQQLFELRRKRVEARHAWTRIIKQKQEEGGYYRTERGNEEFSRLTTDVNMALFGVRDFGGDRDQMSMQQQMTIEAFEIFLARQHARHRSMTPTALISKALREF